MNGFDIGEGLENWIYTNLSEGSTILELGSGSGTGRLAKKYKMYSIESEKEWMDKYDSTYLFCPLKGKWYNPDFIFLHVTDLEYDLLLVDAPRAVNGDDRLGFIDNIKWFKTNIPIIIDDTHRPHEMKLARMVGEKVGRVVNFITDGVKEFAVI